MGICEEKKERKEEQKGKMCVNSENIGNAFNGKQIPISVLTLENQFPKGGRWEGGGGRGLETEQLAAVGDIKQLRRLDS